MDFNRLTLKSQEAVAGAQELARRAGNPELTPDHLTIALLDQELVRTLVERSGEAAASLRAEAEARLASLPTISGGNAQPQVSARFSRVLDKAVGRSAGRSATRTCRSSTCCSRSTSSTARGSSRRSRRYAEARR